MKKVIYTSSLSQNYELVYGGIRIGRKRQVEFNWDSDNRGEDVIFLKSDTSGEYNNEGGVQFIYAYEYNPDSTPAERTNVRRYMKDLPSTKDIFSENIDRFVENAIFRLDQFHKLSEFGATVTSQSSHHPSMTDMMRQFFSEYCRNSNISFELLKKAYQDVEFDADAAAKAMENAGMGKFEISKNLSFNRRKFEELKASGELFQMKRFIPREIRAGFKNFLKFASEEEQHVYESLQGVDVLIYDDFLTSGATVREIIRYLRSFHDKNRLTVFVLVNQH